MENNFDAPPASEFYYNTDADHRAYTICVNQEVWNNDDAWVCDGTGVASAGFPPREIGSNPTCTPNCGVCGRWNGDTWEAC